MCALLLMMSQISLFANGSNVTKTTEITQHGVTWTFAEPVEAGRFITGDWWVVGPATVVAVSPASGALPTALARDGADIASRYGAAAMRDDRSMRNGSMLSPKPGREQGYDSRLKNYNPSLGVVFPCKLTAGDSLVSSISNTTMPVPVLLSDIMWKSEKNAPLALRAVAVLTCVKTPPPSDAFRPPYCGHNPDSESVFLRTADIRWDRLPRLASPSAELVPSWAQYERYFERPWLDHVTTWFFQHLGPSENQANYGREFSRVGSVASLMLMLDAPREQREKLMHCFLQFGIDLNGLAHAGRNWPADGGHWNGRKWPILFASLMLEKLPPRPSAGVIFSEDQQTYHGSGWCGQAALFRMVNHTGVRSPYEEKNPSEWNDSDKLSERYRIVVSGGWPGTALAALHMRAKATWNHDAFFDYCDRWMSKADPYSKSGCTRKRPAQEGRGLDPFVDAMWAAHRDTVPCPDVCKPDISSAK